jgi:hypothetical protein
MKQERDGARTGRAEKKRAAGRGSRTDAAQRWQGGLAAGTSPDATASGRCRAKQWKRKAREPARGERKKRKNGPSPRRKFKFRICFLTESNLI